MSNIHKIYLLKYGINELQLFVLHKNGDFIELIKINLNKHTFLIVDTA
jgi:hypothetical protein